jgi:hypothetical protein
VKVYQRIIVNVLLALLPVGLRAQEAEPKSPMEQPIEAPVTLNGQGPSLAFESEKTRSSYLSGGIAATGQFNQNLGSTSSVNDMSFLIQPYFNYDLRRSRLDWNMNLETAFIIHNPISEENQTAEALQMNLTYRLTPYVNVRASSSFGNTTGLFSALNRDTSGSGIGAIEAANNSLFLPPTQRSISTENLAELNYQFGPKSIAGMRGSFSLLDFPDSSSNPDFGPLYNTRTLSGQVFYNYQVNETQWLGVVLQTQQLETQSFAGNTKTGSLLFLYARSLTPKVKVSFFGGPEQFSAPEISSLTTAGGRGQQWIGAGGATLTWQGGNTSLLAGFSREINDGGGLSSAGIAANANAQFRCRLGSVRELIVGVTYTNNQPIESYGSYNSFGTFFKFNQQLTRNVTMQIGYSLERQGLLNGLPPTLANYAWVSVSYGFSHPIGK